MYKIAIELSPQIANCAKQVKSNLDKLSGMKPTKQNEIEREVLKRDIFQLISDVTNKVAYLFTLSMEVHSSLIVSCEQLRQLLGDSRLRHIRAQALLKHFDKSVLIEEHVSTSATKIFPLLRPLLNEGIFITQTNTHFLTFGFVLRQNK